MFGSSSYSSHGAGSGSGSEIIRSGYNVKEQLQDLGTVRTKFQDALTLRDSDCNEATLDKYANIEGQVRGFNAIAKRVSKQKLNAARAISQTHQIMWQHAQSATQMEIQWQQTAARNLEQMSEKMLDMSTTQQSHSGYAQHLDTADRMITY